MLDSDLAELYQVETKRLKEQVKRNINRFRQKYMFELTVQEFNFLRSQFGTLKFTLKYQQPELHVLSRKVTLPVPSRASGTFRIRVICENSRLAHPSVLIFISSISN